MFFVGGFPRDCILGQKTKDIDLIIEGNAINFFKNYNPAICQKDFYSPLIEIKSTHKDFATVKVKYKNITTDVASTRIEEYCSSGALPSIIKTDVSIEEDVKRRDFTINSLYIEINLNKNNELEFTLIDLVNGIKDIDSRTLRVLHKKSYIDDPTRILRGLDFKHRFNFKFSTYDNKLIKEYIEYIDKNLIFNNNEKISKDRIKSVFFKVLSSSNNERIFKNIINKKFYKLLNLTIDHSSNPQEEQKSKKEQTYSLQENKFSKSTIELTSKLIKKFKLNKKETAEFYLSILECKAGFEIKDRINDKLELYKTFSKFNNYQLAYYYFLFQDSNIDTYLKIKDIKLKIKGCDLIKQNYPQGRIIGEILDSLLKEKFNNPKLFTTKEDEINWVLKNYPNF